MFPDVDEEANGTSVQHLKTNYRARRSLVTVLIGSPLSTAEAPHQTISKTVGLAVFASDALSSTAYATQEMFVVLAAGGAAAFSFAFPLSLAIVGLLVVLTLSYEQTIHAYPGGGGAYIVSRDNLGELPAGIAGAALLTDYVLTVAVSVSSGVAQIVSAFPALFSVRATIAVSLVFFVMLINLRGVKESGKIFAVPTYFFVAMMTLTVASGLWRYFTGSLGPVVDPPPIEMIRGTQAVGLFLILRAFSGGTTALTGVEAISNGIPSFRPPSSRNAGITLIWMSAILGTLLVAITFLSMRIGALPSEQETVISQLTRTALGSRGVLYLATIAGTTVILIMAANTSFAGFPWLSALLAQDGLLPRQLAFRGSRLVFSRGITVLALLASALIVIFDASVTGLIPLYAIGVFLSFTLSQTGMARRWWKCGHLPQGAEVKERGSTLSYDRGWRIKMVINGVGSICTAMVAVIFAVTKFSDGAWVVIILIPVMVALFFRIHAHYRVLARQLSLEHIELAPRISRNRVILPIGGVHQGTLTALRYACALSDDITAVHVSVDPVEAERVRQKWELWGDGVRLVILDSPYRLMLEPLIDYIEQMRAHAQPNETITVVVPQFVPRNWFDQLLHTQTALLLRLALLFRRGVVVTDIPYQVD